MEDASIASAGFPSFQDLFQAAAVMQDPSAVHETRRKADEKCSSHSNDLTSSVVAQLFDPEWTGPLPPPQLDVDVPRGRTSVVVPAHYMKPNAIYEFEVLATDRGGKQTITAGGAVGRGRRLPAASFVFPERTHRHPGTRAQFMNRFSLVRTRGSARTLSGLDGLAMGEQFLKPDPTKLRRTNIRNLEKDT